MALALLAALIATSAHAQALRFSNYREVAPPESATLHQGPFYSSWVFSQQVGYRYTRSSGAGTDFIQRNERGSIRKDGSELPLISTFSLRNYLMITPHMDVNADFAVGYQYYPLGTQDNGWFFSAAEQGIFGTFESQFQLTPYLKGRIYDNPSYRKDYVDYRGITDNYGGQKYERFENEAGTELDWLLADDKNAYAGGKRVDVVPRGRNFKDTRSVSYEAFGGYEQQLHPTLTAGGRAAYDWSHYPTGDRGDYFSQNYSAYSTWQLTERSVLSDSIGYSIASLSSAGAGENNGDSSTVVGSVALKTQLGKDLSHSLSYARSQKSDFQSGIDITDDYAYSIRWAGGFWSAEAGTEYSVTAPQLTTLAGYSDWITYLNLTYALTKWMTLFGNTSYDVRANGTVPVGSVGSTDPSVSSDYETWVTRIGTSFGLTKNVTFSTYGEHAARTSDSENFAYTRDTFEAMLVYTHEF